MEAAVDAVVDLRWGADGIFDAASTRISPWLNPSLVGGVPRPSESAIAATKALCRYIWDTYGRFPATIDPFLMTVWYQAQHLDLGFYDRFYPPDAVPRHVRDHMRTWHGGHP